ncbi:unnamed protein product [Laminaria digitata]
MLRSLALIFSLFLAISLTACTPAVGDECKSNLECDSSSAGGICDVSIPGGYCTVADCVPNGCPDDSVCVAFDEVTSFCMEACLEDGDCREGHACRERGTYGETGYGFCYVAPGG